MLNKIARVKYELKDRKGYFNSPLPDVKYDIDVVHVIKTKSKENSMLTIRQRTSVFTSQIYAEIQRMLS